MSRISLGLAAAFAFGFGAAAHATSVPVTADGSWYSFDVDGDMSVSGGLEWIDFDGEALQFTFAGSDLLLTIVDGGFGGDTFRVFDNGNLLGTTSDAVDTFGMLDDSVGLDFDAALADSNYSFASFLLGGGSHVITGQLARSALADGFALNATVGGLRVSAVPLPASFLLLLSGSGLLGLIRRRRALRA